MRIENEVLLDYSDVLIRPKRSTLGSRKEVNLEREFTFRNYNKQDIMSGEYDWKGVPIMASNMDGVGTFEMADKLAEGNIFTCLVKTYSEQDLIKYFTSDLPERSDYVAMSIGIQDRDLNKFEKVYTVCKENLKYVCIDVANGYSQRFVEFVGEFKFRFPKVVIIAGNVVTADNIKWSRHC